jgi:hypothetical protein
MMEKEKKKFMFEPTTPPKKTSSPSDASATKVQVLQNSLQASHTCWMLDKLRLLKESTEKKKKDGKSQIGTSWLFLQHDML